MAQPTIPPTQYKISDLVRNAVRSVLSAGQNYVNGGAIMVNRSDTSAEVPRMEVDVNNISRASTQMVYASAASNWIYNHFAVDVSVKVVSDRYDGGAIHHEDMVQRVRYLMAREAQSFVSPVVTFFEVLDIEEAQETHDIAEDVREDHSTLNYRMQLGLLPAVYAVPSVGHAA